MAANYLVVMTTIDDEAAAQTLANGLIEGSLAACVNILPAMQSTYLWQGKCHTDRELQLFIKTTRQRYTELEAYIRDNHPYDLPEIIAIPIEAGLANYLDWIKESCEENP